MVKGVHPPPESVAPSDGLWLSPRAPMDELSRRHNLILTTDLECCTRIYAVEIDGRVHVRIPQQLIT